MASVPPPRECSRMGSPSRILERAVLLGGHRKELELGELEDDPHRRLRALHGRVGRAEPDVHLPAQHRLDGQLLVRESGPFVVEPVGLRPVERDEEGRKLVGRRFGQRNPDPVRLRGGDGQPENDRQHHRRHGRLPENVRHHLNLPVPFLHACGRSSTARRVGCVCRRVTLLRTSGPRPSPGDRASPRVPPRDRAPRSPTRSGHARQSSNGPREGAAACAPPCSTPPPGVPG